MTPMCRVCTSLETSLLAFDSQTILLIEKNTQQRCDRNRNTGLEVFILKVNGDLGDGQDEQGGNVGGHQLVHRVSFQPALITDIV